MKTMFCNPRESCYSQNIERDKKTMLTVNEAIIAHGKWWKDPDNFPKVDWSKVPLRWENLAGVNLRGAILAGAKLQGAILAGANLAGANLSGVKLRWTNLSGVNFREAILSGADLSGANLSGADLSGADLFRADLSGADLTGVILAGAILTRADLTEADLRGVNLREVNLYRANLSKADLTGAKLPEPKVKLPPKGESHIGYKKVRGNLTHTLWTLTLRIEEDSDRVCPVNGFNGQCRASKVTVIAAENRHGNPAPESMEFYSIYNSGFRYRVGETKVEPNYNGSITEYSVAGIHYFTDKKMAMEYTG